MEQKGLLSPLIALLRDAPVITLGSLCRLALVLALLAPAFHVEAADEAPYPRVYRTFMPDSGPSAFAIEMSPTLALCYDPLRGGVNAVWEGSVDLSPTLRAKINGPAVMKGEVFYREKERQPLRLLDARADAVDREPVRRLKGYRYEPAAVTFIFTLDGVTVTETLSLSADGRGLVRKIQQPEGKPLLFIADEQTGAQVTMRDAVKQTGPRWHAQTGGFQQVISPRPDSSR